MMKGYFKKILFLLWVKCPSLVAYFYIRFSSHLNFSMWGVNDFQSHLKSNCEFFLTKEQLDDKKFMRHLKTDILICYVKYGTNVNEYFCYKFSTLSSKERNTFLPRKRKDVFLINYYGNTYNEIFDQLKNKYNFYLLMKEYYSRDACLLSSDDDFEEFNNFFLKHKYGVVKPINGGSGIGIHVVNIKDFKFDIKSTFKHLRSYGSAFIVEEVVEQDHRLGKWNPSSLNTIRIPSIMTRRGIKVFYPSLRIGRAGSFVDNAGSGGIFAALDSEKGVVISNGYDKHGNQFFEHPDSHIKFLGEQIPLWDDLLHIISEAHHKVKDTHKYIAFDMALSTKGWVMIEGNWGELSMPQIEFGRGLYREFVEVMNA